MRIAISMRLFNKNKENQLFHIFKKAGDRYSEIYDHLNSVIVLDISGNLLSLNKPPLLNNMDINMQDFEKPLLNVFFKSEALKGKQSF